MAGDNRPHVILVGSGGQPYREYSFKALADHYRLSALLGTAPTWQRRYLDRWRVADLGDESGVAEGIAALLGADAEEGVLTWDETALEITALAAETLSLPHMSARSATSCRDKYLTRSLLHDTGLATVRYGLASSAAEAVRIADSVGYPVVVKPRALAGSIGVARAEDATAVADAFQLANGAAFATLPTGHGVLVEEYLDGPEISVDSVVADCEVSCVHVVRKRLGFAPYFEEVGHLVTGWADEPWAEAVRTLVTTAHRTLGVERGVTHAEVRLTSNGPRLVELNGRLGGDFIPYIGQCATGTDLVRAAAELALGRRPSVLPEQRRAAEVRFIYPEHDGIVRRVGLERATAVPGIAHAAVLTEPGTRLLLPPRQAIPRLAALIAVADDPQGCASILDRAQSEVDAQVDTLPSC